MLRWQPGNYGCLTGGTSIACCEGQRWKSSLASGGSLAFAVVSIMRGALMVQTDAGLESLTSGIVRQIGARRELSSRVAPGGNCCRWRERRGVGSVPPGACSKGQKCGFRTGIRTKHSGLGPRNRCGEETVCLELPRLPGIPAGFGWD